MRKKTVPWGLAAALVPPLLLMVLFRLLKGSRAVMDAWVFGVLAYISRFFARLCSLFPFSVAEALVALLLAGSLFWLGWTAVRFARERKGRDLGRRLLALAAVYLWLLAGFDWLWNAVYYASDFTARSGLEVEEYSTEKLRQVTLHFACRAGELSAQVERDGEGRFAVSVQECLDRGTGVYDRLTEEFTFLDVLTVKAKPLLFSALQSKLGFTGIYSPFTGEANVNVDAPTCLLPATIAHEMAHQCMVAPEEQANFVGIAACVTSGDVVFQYSGYLMGLIHLSNALYSVDREGWNEVRALFAPQIVTDWNDNNAYWQTMQSPMENAAQEVYDSFLKGNDQTMGVRSYGACVDLLVAWYGEIL